jgi:hypothetical protein
MAGFEITNPCDSLPAEGVKVSIIPNREGNIAPMFGEHNSPPTAYIEKGQREKLAAPDFLHDALTD